MWPEPYPYHLYLKWNLLHTIFLVPTLFKLLKSITKMYLDGSILTEGGMVYAPPKFCFRTMQYRTLLISA